MRASKTLPSWRLPPGVSRGTWDYAQSTSVAEDYDEYHAFNPLFDFEEAILREEFARPGRVADLGCGTGRALLPLLREGYHGLAVDLSEKMLAVVREKAALSNLTVDCVQANLVELDVVPSESVDYAMCLFSTLGMIRRRANRRRALGHMQRILRPGGRLVLHVHNLWSNLRGPSGPWWVLCGAAKSLVKRDWELGDKYFPYRGVPNFFLHVFRKNELRADLASAGLRVRRFVSLDARRRHALAHPWLLPALRTNGWIIACER